MDVVSINDTTTVSGWKCGCSRNLTNPNLFLHLMEKIPDVNLITWSQYDAAFGYSEGAIRLPVSIKIKELQINTGIEVIVK